MLMPGENEYPQKMHDEIKASSLESEMTFCLNDREHHPFPELSGFSNSNTVVVKSMQLFVTDEEEPLFQSISPAISESDDELFPSEANVPRFTEVSVFQDPGAALRIISASI
jgi:hypothetical protein